MATKQELEAQVERKEAYIDTLEDRLGEAYDTHESLIRLLENCKKALSLTEEQQTLMVRQAEIIFELNALASEITSDSHQERDHASNDEADEETQ